MDGLDRGHPDLGGQLDQLRRDEVRGQDVAGRALHPRAPRPGTAVAKRDRDAGRSQPVGHGSPAVRAQHAHGDVLRRQRLRQQGDHLLEPPDPQRAGHDADRERLTSRPRGCPAIDARPLRGPWRQRRRVDGAAHRPSGAEATERHPRAARRGAELAEQPVPLVEGALRVVRDRVVGVHAVAHVAQLRRVRHAVRAELERPQEEVEVVHVPVGAEAAEPPPQLPVHEAVGRGHGDVVAAQRAPQRPRLRHGPARLRVPRRRGVIGGERRPVGVDEADRAEEERRPRDPGDGPRVLEPLRLEDVVGVQDRDVLSARELDGAVDRGVGAAVGLTDEVQVGAGALGDHPGRAVPGAVIDDHELAGGQRLRPNAVHGLAHVALMLVRRDHDREPRADGAGGRTHLRDRALPAEADRREPACRDRPPRQRPSPPRAPVPVVLRSCAHAGWAGLVLHGRRVWRRVTPPQRYGSPVAGQVPRPRAASCRAGRLVLRCARPVAELRPGPRASHMEADVL